MVVFHINLLSACAPHVVDHVDLASGIGTTLNNTSIHMPVSLNPTCCLLVCRVLCRLRALLSTCAASWLLRRTGAQAATP